MKRSDLQPGEEYVTSYGAHIRIVDLQTGWLLKNSGWVRDERVGVRLKPGKNDEPYQTYPLNPNVRCVVIDQDGNEKPGVVRPQLVARTWQEHQRIERTRAREQREARRSARQVRAALKTLLPNAEVDLENGTLIVPLSEAAHLGNVAS